MPSDPSELRSATALDEATRYVEARCLLRPHIGLVLGSGLSQLAAIVESPTRIPFGDIPHHPRPRIAGHPGRLVLGHLEGVPVAVWQGRVHYYEGQSMADVVFSVRLLDRLGGRVLILTNAAGGLNASFRVGDVMIVDDHLNLPGLAGHGPLRGLAQNEGDDPFVSLVGAYDAELRALACSAAAALDEPVRQGIYAMVSGPNYETPAEGRMLRSLGADAVGMSTVPEVIVARKLGLRVLALSTITNLVAIAEEGGAAHVEVLDVARESGPRLARLLRQIIRELPIPGMR